MPRSSVPPTLKLVAVASIVAMLSACSVYAFQERRLRHKIERAGLTEQVLEASGTRVRYWEGGKADGETVLLLHGFGGDGMFLWHPQVKPLTREFRVVMPDLVWFGQSTSESTEYNTVFQAQTFVALLDEQSIDKVHVVGVSYGGLVALELANGWPDRVDKMVIVDSPGHTYSLADYQNLLESNDISSVADLVIPSEPAGVKRLVGLAYHRPPPVPPFVQRDVYAHMFQSQTKEKRHLINNLLERAATVGQESYTIDHDTLVLWGEFDRLFPVPVGERLAAALNAPIEVIPRTNHAPNIERPRPFNSTLLDFLQN